MSLAALQWAWERATSPTDKLVLLALAQHTNGRDREAVCWPSLTTLEAMTGLARSSVCRSLDRLAAQGEAGAPLIIRRPGSGRRPTVYGLLIEGWGNVSSPTLGPQQSPPETIASPRALPQWLQSGTPVVSQRVTLGPTVGPELEEPPNEPEETPGTPRQETFHDRPERGAVRPEPDTLASTADADLPDFLAAAVGGGARHG
jgi:hypothetical protein